MSSILEEATGTRTKVITIAVGGATCSGKTTLAKHLRSCLHDSFIVHQDDFAPPQELVPVHPEYNVQDWDDAPGAIEWPRLVAFLQQIKRTGVLPESHKSHDHLNENKEVPVDERVLKRWRERTKQLARRHQEKYAEKIVWIIVDGFLMYWDEKVINELDVRIFLRVKHDVLRERRHERHGYHTAGQFESEGTLWRDPPHYWERIVYPAYVKAHEGLFEGGDVENGRPTDKIRDMLLFEGTHINLEDVVTKVMENVIGVTEEL